MAISFKNAQNAHEAFERIKGSVLPELKTNSSPEDMKEWSAQEREFPNLNTVYGFGKKADGGWENLMFFVRDPSEELKKRFNELEWLVPNSSMCEPYDENPDIWIIGWY